MLRVKFRKHRVGGKVVTPDMDDMRTEVGRLGFKHGKLLRALKGNHTPHLTGAFPLDPPSTTLIPYTTPHWGVPPQTPLQRFYSHLLKPASWASLQMGSSLIALQASSPAAFGSQHHPGHCPGHCCYQQQGWAVHHANLDVLLQAAGASRVLDLWSGSTRRQ